MVSSKTARYENLDYLRGLCALSIMGYHYIGWTLGGFDAGTLLGRLGVYGVSMFYVLSGLTMYLVYFKSFGLGLGFFKSFYIKRFFRIYPLMWLIMITALLIYGSSYTPLELFINFSGLFSILDWSAEVPVGVWSIGNELSFYLMLPLFFYCIKKGNFLIWLMILITFGVYFYFAFFLLDNSYSVSEQESLYKNPLNQIALFLGGLLIGHLFRYRTFNNYLPLTFLILSSAAFWLYPVNGNVINVITGKERIIFTTLCFIITFGFFKSNMFFIHANIKKGLRWLGEISYSLYLIHPHIFTLLALTGLKIRFVFPLAVVLTFSLSWLVYWILETPSRKLGAWIAASSAKLPA
jgi:exopolysaccharide production protein ExoZ